MWSLRVRPTQTGILNAPAEGSQHSRHGSLAHHTSAPVAGNEVAKNINKNNAQHAIVFEAVSLALAMDADTELLQASVSLLGKFISVREPNIKYLGLENMVRLAEVPAVIDTIHR